ncbi:MAG TPA: hypothetical protein VFZ73_12210 [Gemmatimonadaceae bacterium]
MPCYSLCIRLVVPLWLLVMLSGCAGEEAVAARDSLDTRTPIELPAEGRAMILSEMRGMLGALSQFLGGAAENDTARMRVAATSAGMKAAVDIDPRISALLPAEFLELGEGTHAAFDSLAMAASGGEKHDVLMGRLSGILGRCVSCHATYRLEIGSAPTR